jgi:hypothetical protein
VTVARAFRTASPIALLGGPDAGRVPNGGADAGRVPSGGADAGRTPPGGADAGRTPAAPAPADRAVAAPCTPAPAADRLDAPATRPVGSAPRAGGTDALPRLTGGLVRVPDAPLGPPDTGAPAPAPAPGFPAGAPPGDRRLVPATEAATDPDDGPPEEGTAEVGRVAPPGALRSADPALRGAPEPLPSAAEASPASAGSAGGTTARPTAEGLPGVEVPSLISSRPVRRARRHCEPLPAGSHRPADP